MILRWMSSTLASKGCTLLQLYTSLSSLCSSVNSHTVSSHMLCADRSDIRFISVSSNGCSVLKMCFCESLKASPDTTLLRTSEICSRKWNSSRTSGEIRSSTVLEMKLSTSAGDLNYGLTLCAKSCRKGIKLNFGKLMNIWR
jgi:hypothetical protein